MRRYSIVLFLITASSFAGAQRELNRSERQGAEYELDAERNAFLSVCGAQMENVDPTRAEASGAIELRVTALLQRAHREMSRLARYRRDPRRDAHVAHLARLEAQTAETRAQLKEIAYQLALARAKARPPAEIQALEGRLQEAVSSQHVLGIEASILRSDPFAASTDLLARYEHSNRAATADYDAWAQLAEKGERLRKELEICQSYAMGRMIPLELAERRSSRVQ